MRRPPPDPADFDVPTWEQLLALCVGIVFMMAALALVYYVGGGALDAIGAGF
jgi:hypothetical protein